MTQPVAQGSIRQRLLISLQVSAAVLAVVVFLVVQTVARQVAQESQDNVLAASATSILESARYRGGELHLDLPYSALSMLDNLSHERVFYAIHLGGEFLSGYDALPHVEGKSSDRAGFGSSEFLGEDVRIASIEKRVSTDAGHQSLTVSVAQTLTGQKQTLARISRTAMGVGATFYLVSVILAALIARSAIQPLDRLTKSVSRRGPKDLRPVAGPVLSEMVPLVASLNSLMRRLHRSLLRSEEFIAEAGHRVRTPLAIVRTKAEIVQRQIDDPKSHNALNEMIHAIDESSRTASQLLDHAMVTFRLDHLLREEIDLPKLLTDAVARSRPLCELKDIDMSLEIADETALHGDPILLQNAIHNLLDNAVKYTPSGTTVCVDLKRLDNGVRIRVHDDGPGFPGVDFEHFANRFARGDNAQDVVGSGLGLTIVKEVVEAHDGRVLIENNAGGGACVSLFFHSA